MNSDEKLRSISDLCRQVLSIDDVDHKESNLRFLGAQEMAKEVMEIVGQNDEVNE